MPKYCFAGGKYYSSCNTFENIGASWYVRFVIVSMYNVCSCCLECVFDDTEILKKILIIQDMEISYIKYLGTWHQFSFCFFFKCCDSVGILRNYLDWILKLGLKVNPQKGVFSIKTN